MVKENKCQFRGCSKIADIYYFSIGLCEKHWTHLCEKPTDDMKRILDVKPPSKKIKSKKTPGKLAKKLKE